MNAQTNDNQRAYWSNTISQKLVGQGAYLIYAGMSDFMTAG